ncbi:hypothetical protein CROQUDRAFT_671447 [Cronartium quercuum f. sp. fusiforme G11]|uniref:Uncharacterized protein n=1 Tax=Cronartium quercuum f. sp. fusiforme G11 TaxID=708437 RepID=A0A9P6NFJ6_9BASI|nr:hypothetical protein CROQUDRAFT_671447 [Cronartium quercuum f. sp. fusiforme G11]
MISTPHAVQSCADQKSGHYSIHMIKSPNGKPHKVSPSKMKSPAERGAIRVRRPFKYIKHLGPRPFPGPPASKSTTLSRTYPSDKRINVHTDSNQNQYPTPGSKSPTKTPMNDPIVSASLGTSDKPYSQAPSRLLRSRNLNLSALDISVCKLKRPPVVLSCDDPESASRRSAQPLTARHSQRMSCFSDWSASTSAAQMLSHSIATPSNQAGSHLTPSLESFSIIGSREVRNLKQRSESYHGPELCNLALEAGAIKTPASVMPWTSNENQRFGEA